MAEIADGNILADIELEIAAAGCEHKTAFNGWRPDHATIYDLSRAVTGTLFFVPSATFLDNDGARPCWPPLCIE